MPTRKQQRRRAKTFRHEFDFVVADDEGNEVPVAPAELRAAKKKDAPARRSTAKGKDAKKKTRERRDVPPPSWNRSIRRGIPMGAVSVVVILLLVHSLPLALLYGVAFVPFTYYVDSFMYRLHKRRAAKG
jgi:hypothetical protein